MAQNSNAATARKAYEAFGKGDIAALSALIADKATWHITDVGPLNGTYVGRDDILGYLGKLGEETGGTFKLEVHDVLGSDDHAVGLTTARASRGGKKLETSLVHVFHIGNEQITELWSAMVDPVAIAEFWK